MSVGRAFQSRANPSVPKRRDLVFLDFDPSAGKETPGLHPALVITSSVLNRDGLATVCHVSSQPFDSHTVVLAPGAVRGIDGFIHYRQVRSIDWTARKIALAGRCPQSVFDDVIAHMLALLDPALSKSAD